MYYEKVAEHATRSENYVLQKIQSNPVHSVVAVAFAAAFFLAVTTDGCKLSVGNADSMTIGNPSVAPADHTTLLPMNIEAFIERFSKIAVAEMDKFQIPASISMGQAIIESRAGKSILATKNNNMFGIKCFLKPGANATCGKTHCTNHFDDTGKDFFRKYENGWDSWREHSQFLTKERYQPLFKAGKDYKAWAKGLRALGYATDPDYEKKLISVIERYKLYKLDNL